MIGTTIAALDLGSNTFRLMVAEPQKNCPHWGEAKIWQSIPRLSENLIPGEPFAPAALGRAWDSLAEFAEHVSFYKPQKVLACATMAARLASDGPDFMAEIARRYGWETAIISGTEEARLTALGLLPGLRPKPDFSVIFDLGGRSTELIWAEKGEIKTRLSLPLGVVELTEKYLSAPASSADLAKVAEAVQAGLAQLPPEAIMPKGATLVGTAGTATTTAALHLKLTEYRPELVHNCRLTKGDVAALLAKLAPKTVEQRTRDHALHPRRADAIVAGLIVILEIMGHFGQDDLLVSDHGLLEGIWCRAANIF